MLPTTFSLSGSTQPAPTILSRMSVVVMMPDVSPSRATTRLWMFLRRMRVAAWATEASGSMKIAGRKLEVHVASFAATEADLWLYLPKERIAIVGDLVVDIVPFMDTACPDGWEKALEEIEAIPFATLIPGHGAPMTRIQFVQWKQAFASFVDCGRSTKIKEECVANWKRDAAPFIDAEHSRYVIEAATYYLETRLRSSAARSRNISRPAPAARASCASSRWSFPIGRG